MNTLSGTNIAAINAISNGNYAHKKISSSLERLASGTRVNSYRDNITTALANTSANSQIGAISSDIQNVNETLSMLRIADQALEDQIRILNKVRVKAVNAASDGVSKRDRFALQNEIRLLLDDLDDVAQQTTFKGDKLLTGEYLNKNIAFGSKSNEQYKYSIGSSQSDDIGRVRYETINRGSRDIDDLILNFKEVGINKEDVRLAPFTLSSSAGKTLKDLVNHVNANTNRLGGIRAIYKEGVAPNKKDAKRLKDFAKFKAQSQTTSFYQEKDFEYVDYTKEKPKVGKIIFPVAKTSWTFPQEKIESLVSSPDPKGLHSTSGEVERGGTVELDSFPSSSMGMHTEMKDKGELGGTKGVLGSYAFPSGTMGTREVKTSLPKEVLLGSELLPDPKGVELDGDIPYRPVFRAGPLLTGPGKTGYTASFGPGTVPNDAAALARAHDGNTTRINEFGAYNSSVVFEFDTVHKSGAFRYYNSNDIVERRATDSKIIFYGADGVENHRTTLTTAQADAYPLTITPPDNLEFKKVIFQTPAASTGHGDQHAVRWREFQVFGTPKAPPKVTINNTTINEAAANDGSITQTRLIDLEDGTLATNWKNNFAIANLPVGIHWTATKESNTQIKVSFTGKAYAHTNDINNIDFEFNKAFVVGNTRDINVGNTKGIKLDFLANPIPTATLVGTNIFSEVDANDGSIRNTVDINLGDELKSPAPYLLANNIAITAGQRIEMTISTKHASAPFFGAPGADWTRSEANLLPVLDKSGIYNFNGRGGTYQVELRGTGGDRYDIFLIDTGGGLVDGSGTAKHINFLVWNGATGTRLAGRNTREGIPDISKPFVELDVQNVPTGLSVSYKVKADKKTVTLELSGKGVPHKNAQDEPNLRFSFKGTFEGGVSPTNPLVTKVDFKDVPITAKIQGVFNEVIADNGKIDKKVDIKFSEDLILPPGVIDGTYRFNLPRAIPTHMKIDLDWIPVAFLGGLNMRATYKGTVINMVIEGALDLLAVTPTAEIKANTIQFKSEGRVGWREGIGTEFDTKGTEFELDLTSPNLDALTKLKLSYEIIDSKTVRVELSGLATPHDTDINNLRFEFDGVFKTGETPEPIVDAKIDFIGVPPIATITPSIFQEKMPENMGAIGNTAIISLGDNVLGTFRYTTGFGGIGFGRPTIQKLKFGAFPEIVRSFTPGVTHNITINGIDYKVTPGWHGGTTRANLSFDKQLPPNALPIRYGTRVASPIPARGNEFRPEVLRDAGIPNIAVSNLPAGLRAEYTVLNPAQVRVTLRGDANALSHEDKHDVDNLEFSFSGNFSGGVAPADIVDASIDFEDKVPVLELDTHIFSERTLNDGNMEPAGIILSVSEGQFVDVLTLGLISLENVPAGLTPIFTRMDASHIKIILDGVAISHTDPLGPPPENRIDLEFSFVNSLVKNNVRVLNDLDLKIGGAGDVRETIEVRFIENVPTQATIIGEFKEETDNNGKIIRYAKNNTIINLGDKVTGVRNDSPDGIYDAGPGAGFRTITSIFVDRGLPGGGNHGLGGAVGEARPVATFRRNGVLWTIRHEGGTRFSIDTGNQARVRSLGFLSGAWISGAGFRPKPDVPNVVITSPNLPTGLFIDYKLRADGETAEIELLGRASNHTTDRNDIRFDFTGTFSGFVNPLPITTAVIDFISPILTISNHKFSEKIENDGTISNTLTLNLDQGKFVTNIDGKISLIGVPDNLDRSFVLINASNIEITLTGTAVSHHVIDNLDVAGKYLKFDFEDDLIAFNREVLNTHNVMAPGGVEVREKIELKFLNPSLHLDSLSFAERAKNDGITDTVLKLNIRGASFTPNIIGVGNISLEGLPSPLVASFTRIDSSNIAINISGRAISHQEMDSLKNLKFTFDDGLMFDNGDRVPDFNLTPIFSGDNEENINGKVELNFIDNIQPIAKMLANFSEVDDNDGSIRERVYINLNDDYYSVPLMTTNLKALSPNLRASWAFVNTSQVLVEIIGNAGSHLNRDDIDNLRFDFIGGEFSSGLTPLDVVDASIDFLEAILEIDGDTFTESILNNGTIATRLDITVTYGLFEDIIYKKIFLEDVPEGLKANFLRKDDKTIQVTLQDIAVSHDNKDDRDGVLNPYLHFDFRNNLIKHNKANINQSGIYFNKVNVKDTMVVDFLQGSASFKTKVFTEGELENDGSISNSITLSFDSPIGTGLVDADIVAHNLPAGLTAVYDFLSRKAEGEIVVALTGKALKHTKSDSVDDMYFSFSRNVLENHVDIDNLSGASVNFYEMNIKPLTDTFYEDQTDIGAIVTVMTLNITGNTVGDSIGFNALNNLISATNVPAGLSARFRRLDASNIEARLIHEAGAHDTGDSITNLQFSFHQDVWTIPTKRQTVDDLKVDFFNRPGIEIDPLSKFYESNENIGGIGNTITLKLSGGVFSTISKDNLENYINAYNIPSGLSPVYEIISPDEIEVTLTGEASNHGSGDDINDLRFTFESAIVTTNATISHIDAEIDFFDIFELSLEPVFIESTKDDGSIRNSATISIESGTPFSNITDSNRWKTLIDVKNLPDGLEASFVLIDKLNLEVFLSNKANFHTPNDSVANLRFSFDKEAFEGGIYNIKAYGGVEFYNTPNITMAPTMVEKFENNGEIGNTSTFVLKDDTWNIKEDFLYAAKAFKADNIDIEKIIIDGVDILNGRGSMKLKRLVEEMGYNTNGVGVTTNGGQLITIYAGNDNGTLVFYSNEMPDGDSLNVKFKLKKFGFDNADFLKDDPSVSHSFGNANSIDPKDIGRYITTKNIPTGLNPSYTFIDNTRIRIKLEGKTPEAGQIDVRSLFSFDTELLNHKIPANEASGLVDFIDRATMSLDAYTFSEDILKAGEIDTRIHLSIDGDSFIDEQTAIDGGYFKLNGLPAGLVASFSVGTVDDNIIEISISGVAVNHTTKDNLDNLSLRVNPLAFSSTLNAFNDKGKSSNVIENISLNFLEEANITADSLSFFEHTNNDGSIGNKITFTIAGGSSLRQVNKTLKYGYEIHLLNAKNDGFIDIGGQRFSGFEQSDSIGVIAKKLANQVNAGGLGSFIGGEPIYAKAVGFSLILLKDKTSSIIIGSRAGNTISLPSPSISPSDKTVSINDASVNINDNISFNLADFSGLLPNFTPLNATQIEMELNGFAPSHTKADLDLNLRIEFSSGLFGNVPSNFDATNKPSALVNVIFVDTPTLNVVGKFTEKSDNKGSINNAVNPVKISFDNEKILNILNGGSIAKFVTLKNVPAGLTPSYVIDADKEGLIINLLGNALSHDISNSVDSIEIELDRDMFVDKTKFDTIKNVELDFIEASIITASPSIFQESETNTGLIANTITLSVENGLISDTGGTLTATVLDNLISLVNVPTGLKAEYSYIDNKHIEVRLSSTIAGGVSGVDKHSPADDLDNLRFEFDSDLLKGGYSIEDTDNISIDFGTNINISAITNVFSEEFYSNDGAIDRTITLRVEGGDIKNNIQNFSFASKIDDSILRDIAENGLLKIDGIDLNDKTKGRYYVDTSIRDFTLGTAKEQSEKRAYHVASVINNGYKGTILANGDKLFANVVENGANYEVYLLKNTNTSVMINTEKTTNSFANDNRATPSIRAMRMLDEDASLDKYAAYINVPLGLTPKFKALNKNLIEVELRGNAVSHLPSDNHNLANTNQLEFNFSPKAFIDALYVNHASGVDVRFVDNKINKNVSFLEADFKSGTISAPQIITFDNGILNNGLNLANLITASNVPEGLVPTYSYVVATGISNQIEVSFKGVALSHRPENSIDDLQFNFDRSLFSEMGHSATTKAIGDIRFINQPILEFAPTIVRENSNNTGWIDKIIQIHISDGTLDEGLLLYDGVTWDDAKLTGLIGARVPASIGTIWHIIDSSNIQLELKGFALSHTPADSSGIRYDFNNVGIMSGSVVADDISYVPATATSHQEGIYLSFLGKNTFKDVGEFTEVDTNTGAISNSLIIEISQGGGFADKYFNGSIIDTNASNENLITVDNLPTGLSPIFTKLTDTKIGVRLNGIASKRTRADSTDINFTFHRDLMSLTLVADIISNVPIKFIDVINLSLNQDKFVEDDRDDGRFDDNSNLFQDIIITLSDGELSKAGHTNREMSIRLNDKITVGNLAGLTGLTVSFEYIDTTHIRATIDGQADALSHKSPDHDLLNLNGLVFNFDPDLTVNETRVNSSSGVAVDFINKAVLVLEDATKDTFDESATNIGDIAHTGDVVIKSQNDVNFNSDIDVINANVSFSNLPAGLTASFTFKGVGFSQLEVKLSGRAINHANNYDVANLEFEFKSGAFEDSIAVHSPIMKIDFKDNIQLNALNKFVESVNNDGSIANRVTIRIEGDDAFDLTRIPARVPGAVAGEYLLGAGWNQISLDGGGWIAIPFVASHLPGPHNQTIGGVPYTFSAVNRAGTNFVKVETTDTRNSIRFQATIRIPPNPDIIIPGTTHDTSVAGTPFTDITIGNEPVGLENSSYRVISPKEIEIELKGRVTDPDSHGVDDNRKVSVTFNDRLFAGGGILNANIVYVPISFVDPPVIEVVNDLIYSGKFIEDLENDGSIGNSITLRISNGIIDDGIDINSLITPIDMSPDYQASFRIENPSTIIASLNGKSILNDLKDSSTDLKFSFNGAIFESGVKPDNLEDIYTNYIDGIKTIKQGYFEEDGLNVGRINVDKKVTITLVGDTFKGSVVDGEFKVEDDLNINTYTTLSNIPIGYTYTANITDDKTVILSLSGGSNNHNISDSVNNMTLSFDRKEMFTSGVAPQDVDKIQLKYVDYGDVNIDGFFRESNNNDGSMGEDSKLTIALNNDVFNSVADLSSMITTSNIPNGLIPKYELSTNRRKLIISFDGQAKRHNQSNNKVAEFSFKNTALFGRGITIEDVKANISFFNSSSASYSGEFIEDSNNAGTFKNSELIVTLAGDVFQGTNVNVIIGGLPIGLGIKTRRIGENSLGITLTGEVTDTTKRNVIDSTEVDISFLNVNNFRSGTLPQAITKVPLTFVNSPGVKVTGELVETIEDNGKVGGTLLFTLDGDTFNVGTKLDNPLTISYAGRELAGLSINTVLKNDRELEFSFTGAGFDHKERDVPFEIKFNPALFNKGVSLEPYEDKVKFIKKGDLKLANELIESTANDGSIGNNLTINIENGFFTDVNNINTFSKIENLPIGITGNFSYVNINTLEVSFTGNTISHDIENGINDIKISLGKEVIANEVALNLDDIKLDFLDAPVLIYQNKFVETKADDGSIANGLNVTITKDRMKEGADPAKYMTASWTDKDGNKMNKLPDGLSFKTRVISDSKFILFLEGKADKHAFSNNINNLEIAMSGDFLKNQVAPTTMKDIRIVFADTPTYVVEPIEGFTEGIDDDGSIGNKITVDIEGDEFNANVDIGSFVNITNLPAGLSLSFQVDKADNSKLILELKGNARVHTKEDSSSLRVEFLEGLFRKRVPISAIDIPIKFNTSNLFTIKDTFVEASSNDGTISKTILLTLEGSTMNNVNPNSFITATNVPTGLTAIFNVISSTTLEMRLQDAADAHSASDSTTNDNVTPISLSFSKNLFNNNIPAKPIKIVHIRFIDPPSITSKGKFTEDYTNDGSINTAVTFTVLNDLFSTNQDISKFINATELPLGLSIEYKAITDNRIVASITGKAEEHTKENNSKVSFTFESELFNNGIISNSIDDIPIIFDDIRPALLKVEGEFTEDIQNDGSITTSIIINVLDDKIADKYKFPFSMLVEDIRTLVGNNGNEEGESTFILDGVLFEGIVLEKDETPVEDVDIINAIVEEINNKGAGTNGLYAELTLDRQGLPHLNILKHEEDRAVSVSGATGAVVELENHYNFEDEGYKKEQIALGLEPDDPANAADRAITARQVDVEFALDRLMFDTNLPAGLRSKFTLLDKNRILVEINKKAFKHGREDSIDNYTITFIKEAFEKNLAPAVLDNIPIKFNNPSIKPEGSFSESKANDGSIEGALTLFLTGDEFKDDIDEKLLNGLFAINNLPDGLNGNFIIEAKNIVRFELRGKATEHGVESSINNLSVSFNKKLFKNEIPADKVDFIVVDFIDSVLAQDSSGGSGTDGGYITFISPRGDNLNISAGGASFGVEGTEYQGTMKLIDVFNNQFSTNDLYSIGDEYHPDLTQLNGGYGVGVTSKVSATVFLDTVDAAINELNQTRQRLSSFYQRIQQAGEVLSVEEINLKSANSRLVNIDFAEESAEFNRADILSKAANFALTQSNSLQRDKINYLLDGIK